MTLFLADTSYIPAYDMSEPTFGCAEVNIRLTMATTCIPAIRAEPAEHILRQCFLIIRQITAGKTAIAIHIIRLTVAELPDHPASVPSSACIFPLKNIACTYPAAVAPKTRAVATIFNLPFKNISINATNENTSSPLSATIPQNQEKSNLNSLAFPRKVS